MAEVEKMGRSQNQEFFAEGTNEEQKVSANCPGWVELGGVDWSLRGLRIGVLESWNGGMMAKEQSPKVRRTCKFVQNCANLCKAKLTGPTS